MPKRKHEPSSNGPSKKKRSLWKTEFKHKGPLFPPPYKSIGHFFKYSGKTYKLSKATEEYAVLYAKYLNSGRKADKMFNDNFFKSWRDLMTRQEQQQITTFSKCNFNEMRKQLKKMAENKTKPTGEERKKEVEEYKHVTVDGVEETIGNVLVEPPNIFAGRGSHNLRGTIKRRIFPEDITINCSERSTPKAPSGHDWKEVVHDHSAMWLAKWTDPVTGKPKYIQLAAFSKLKSDSDQQKFERAEMLRKNISQIRKKYQAHLKSEDLKERQHATALYLIDEFALRAGNEKSAEEVDTVGCCSLRKEHVRFGGGNKISFDFHAKDSIRYKNEAKISGEAYRNLKVFCEYKRAKDLIFDEIKTTTLNTYLNELMPGLTAKVFRTFKATECFEESIKKQRLRPDAEKWEQKLACDRANLEVAKLLNHRKLTNGIGQKKRLLNLRKKIARLRAEIKKPKGKGDKKKKENELKRREAELELQAELQNFALVTSKNNYIDPRVIIKWCEQNNIEKGVAYSKQQLKKFGWAMKARRHTEYQ